MSTQHSRILIKRSTSTGVVPTVPTSNDHTDGTWLATDIYKGELFINTIDGLAWTRDDAGIVPLGGTPGTFIPTEGSTPIGTAGVWSIQQVISGYTNNITVDNGNGIVLTGQNSSGAGTIQSYWGGCSLDGLSSDGLSGSSVISGIDGGLNLISFISTDANQLKIGRSISDDRFKITAMPIDYAADYSGAYTSRSLIDKGYADGRYALASGAGYLPLAGGTMSGNILFGTALGIDTSGAGTLNIGNTNATIINIGRTGQTVNILGSTLYENVTNLTVTDKLITLNKGGATTSGNGVGFEVEENSVITGYIKVSSARTGYEFLSPGSSGVATIVMPAANRTYTLPAASGTFILDASAQNITGTKTFTVDQKVSDDAYFKSSSTPSNFILFKDTVTAFSDNGIILNGNNGRIGDFFLGTASGSGLTWAASTALLTDGSSNSVTVSSAGITFNTTKQGFYSTTPISKQNLTFDCGGNTGLQSLVGALANLGLVTNTTALGIFNLSSNKISCDLVSTSNLSLNGAATVDGVAVVTGNRVLAAGQTTGSQNGIYLANTTGAWTRATDNNTGASIFGTLVYITSGSTKAGLIYTCTNTSAITLGTTAITFAAYGSGGSGTVTSVTSADGNATIATTTTTPVITIVSAPKLQTARAINGVNFDGTAAITVTADANTLTGTTLHSTVVSSSLTSHGTITSGGLGTGATIAGVTMSLGSDAVGDMYYAGASNILTRLAAVAAGKYLRSAGTTTAPAWSTLALPNSATANYIAYATSTNTWGESASLQFDGTNLGVGVAPSTLIHAKGSSPIFRFDLTGFGNTVPNSFGGGTARTGGATFSQIQNYGSSGGTLWIANSAASGLPGWALSAIVGITGGLTTTPNILLSGNKLGTSGNPAALASTDWLFSLENGGTGGVGSGTKVFNVYGNGDSHFYTTTDASNATTAGLVIDSGVGIAKKLFVTGNASFAGTMGITGAITATNLAGTGSRLVQVDASGVMTATVKVPATLKTFKADVTLAASATTDFFSYTIPAGTLVNDGDSIEVEYIVNNNNATTVTASGGTLYFNGVSVAGFNDGSTAIRTVRARIMRDSNTSVRIFALSNDGANGQTVDSIYTTVTSINLTTTGYIVKGTWVDAAGVTQTAVMGTIRYIPAE